ALAGRLPLLGGLRGAARRRRLLRLGSLDRGDRLVRLLSLEARCRFLYVAARLLEDVADLVGLGLADDSLLGGVRRRLRTGGALCLALLLASLRLPLLGLLPGTRHLVPGLARFLVGRVVPAPATELAHLDPVRIVTPV